MPFKSQAQRRYMYANLPKIAKRWSKHTPKNKKLPEYVKESLDTSKVGSNLEFKSVIPNADKTEVSVFYGVKSDPSTDLVLIFALGQTADDSDYLYGVTYDKNDPKGRPRKFEDPSSKEAIALLKTYHLTSDDVEKAGQDAYEKIADRVFVASKVLEEPYEESLEFEILADRILNEKES